MGALLAQPTLGSVAPRCHTPCPLGNSRPPGNSATFRRKSEVFWTRKFPPLRIGRSHIVHVTSSESNSDPVPFTILLSLDDVFRILESIEDARFELRQRGSAPGLQDELATVIRMLHGKLGLEEGGSL